MMHSKLQSPQPGLTPTLHITLWLSALAHTLLALMLPIFRPAPPTHRIPQNLHITLAPAIQPNAPSPQAAHPTLPVPHTGNTGKKATLPSQTPPAHKHTLPTTPPTPAPSPQTAPQPAEVAALVSAPTSAHTPPQATPHTRLDPDATNPEAAPPNTTPSAQLTAPALPGAHPAPIRAPQFNAAYLHNPKPIYPAMARRRGLQGQVILQVTVSTEGQALDIHIQQSSGHPTLDEAAKNAVINWRFIPAQQGNTPIRAPVLVPILFKLES